MKYIIAVVYLVVIGPFLYRTVPDLLKDASVLHMFVVAVVVVAPGYFVLRSFTKTQNKKKQ